jgi:tetratricopeptide (TPR) repeat protein
MSSPPPHILTVLLLACALVSCTSAPPPDPAAIDALFKEARAHDAAARHEDAIAVYRRLLVQDPDSFDGHYWMARALDLAGRYHEAREHFERAIDLSSDSNREQTLRMTAIAWTFVSNADQASRYYRQVFDARATAGNYPGASEVANELARMYLELGDLGHAEEWYRTGYDVAAKEQGRSAAQADLAELRWAHAQGRIAARLGRADEAQRHVGVVRTLVEKGTNSGQEPQLAYLRGYVAYHLGDVAGAVEALQSADQEDPFILLLLAQAHERQADSEMARQYYEKVMASTSHAITAAIARPIARERLAASR